MTASLRAVDMLWGLGETGDDGTIHVFQFCATEELAVERLTAELTNRFTTKRRVCFLVHRATVIDDWEATL